MELLTNPIQSFNNNLIAHFSNIYLVIIVNIFFIIAVYTDLKYMKIYNKFNLTFLIARIITASIFGFSTDLFLGGVVVFLTLFYLQNRIAGDIKLEKYWFMVGYSSIAIVLLTVF